MEDNKTYSVEDSELLHLLDRFKTGAMNLYKANYLINNPEKKRDDVDMIDIKMEKELIESTMNEIFNRLLEKGTPNYILSPNLQ